MNNIFDLIQNYFLPFVVTLSVVVFVHEFGHYWVARRCGVKVTSFSIGFGPEIWGRTDRNGTRWKIAALPLGGYVKMFGDADAASTPDSQVYQMNEDEKRVSFFHQNAWKRLAIVSAGPAFNYIFAILLMIGMFSAYGEPYTPPIAQTVVKDGAAEAAGIKPGDRILSLDGERMERFADVRQTVLLNTGTPIQVEIEREGETKMLTVTPRIVDMTDRFGAHHRIAQMGVVSQEIEYRPLGARGAVTEAFKAAWGITRDTLTAVRQMIMGLRSTEELGGALRIAKMSGDVAKTREVPAFIWFIVLISVNLGMINLFPIPMLDGGHILFYALEILRRKPLTERIQEGAMRAGMLVVLCLFVFSTWNDLVQLKIIAYLKDLLS